MPFLRKLLGTCKTLKAPEIKSPGEEIINELTKILHTLSCA